MTAAPANQLDLTPPPVLKKISQRSLIVGAVASVIVAVIFFAFRNGAAEVFRAYLLAYMLWLGIALGSMAIIMIRHLTGGGWGVVIRRIQGAAMRTLPGLSILFLPVLIAVYPGRMYPWAMPLASVTDAHIHKHLVEHANIRSYLNPGGFLIRAVIYFAIWNLLSFLLSKWSKEGDSPSSPDNTG